MAVSNEVSGQAKKEYWLKLIKTYQERIIKSESTILEEAQKIQGYRDQIAWCRDELSKNGS